MVGLDTGFFVEMIRGDRAIIKLWKDYNAGENRPLVSVLTLGELLYMAYRTGTPDVGRTLIDSIDLASRVIPVDRRIMEKTAALKAGSSIPYTDALILATFIINDCKTIHTTDRKHFSQIKKKGINVVFH